MNKRNRLTACCLLLLLVALLGAFPAFAAVRPDNAEVTEGAEDEEIHESYLRQKNRMENSFYDAINRVNEENEKYQGMGAGERMYSGFYRAFVSFKQRGAWVVTGLLGACGLAFVFIGHVTNDVHRKWTGLLLIGFIAVMWGVMIFVIGRWM